MKYRLVQSVEGRLIATECEADNVFAFMEVRGFALSGINSNPRQREELQGQPRFAGLNGPMWDGDAIRYEDPEAYARLSA